MEQLIDCQILQIPHTLVLNNKKNSLETSTIFLNKSHCDIGPSLDEINHRFTFEDIRVIYTAMLNKRQDEANNE